MYVLGGQTVTSDGFRVFFVAGYGKLNLSSSVKAMLLVERCTWDGLLVRIGICLIG